MTDTVTVANSAPMAIRLHTVDPDDPAKVVPDAQTMVLHGSGHPEAIGGVGITHDVPVGLLGNFLAVHPHLADVLHAMTPEQFKAHADAPAQSGFQPGLDAAAAHAEPVPEIPPLPLADEPEPPPQAA